MASASENVDSNTIRVLVTGFGGMPPQAFRKFNDASTSWELAKLLHNEIIYTEPAPPTTITAEPIPSTSNHPPIDHPMEDPNHTEPQRVHITALEVPVTYQGILSTVPALHARPPRIPYPKDPSMKVLPPPAMGYDFFLHIGIAGRGPLRIEKLAHKLNYKMRDADGSYAPVVLLPKEDISIPVEVMTGPIESEIFRRRAGLGSGFPPGIIHEGDEGLIEPLTGVGSTDGMDHQPSRGFGKGYEITSDELYTDLDVSRLIHHLKEHGVQLAYSSMDAGHYLTDFTYYCSLAEAKRAAGKLEKDKGTPPKSVPVLAMHIPPEGMPLSTEEMIDAVKKIILWVVGRPETI